jgi:urease subunit alpha
MSRFRTPAVRRLRPGAGEEWTFVWRAALEEKSVERYGLPREVVAVSNCQASGQKDLDDNSATPEMRVDPDTVPVWVDGEKVGSEPAR